MNPAAVWAPTVQPTDEEYDWLHYFSLHRDLYMAPQTFGWTCSVCAMDWVARATGLDPESNREKVALSLGSNCVNPAVGLADLNCAVRLMSSWGQPDAEIRWLNFDQALSLFAATTGILNSTSWYHFVGVRGLTGDGRLWVANSAQGYKGIYETINRAQWDAWAGSWNTVCLLP